MCRMLGVIASEPTDFRVCLREAPRSLAQLSREHPHGWGVAVFDAREGWRVQKNNVCANEDQSFHAVSAGSRGQVLLAHIRKRTVGPVTLENTHPFQQGRWLFAHNGTVEDLAFLQRRISPERAAQIRGTTDSEVLFAFVLTRLDAAGVVDSPANDTTDAVIAACARDLAAHGSIGPCNFLLADGETLYAHRLGRTLHLLERAPGDAVRASRESIETGAIIETPWTERRHALLVASEQITDEPWVPLEEGTLLRLQRTPSPTWRTLPVR